MAESGRRARLIILCGLPGSGKITLGKSLEARLHAVRFAPDEWMNALALDLYDEARRARIEELQWQLGQQLLQLGLTVIIEWGTWGRSERDRLRLGARALGAAVELHYLSAPLEVLFERVQRRSMENPPIARDALSQWSKAFQAPTAEEQAEFDEPLVSDVDLDLIAEE
ncbi:MAG TPA: ATP-binding protein [Terriglobales bacterium]|nr:ATP-binding protein [Terriglobales bacterium]